VRDAPRSCRRARSAHDQAADSVRTARTGSTAARARAGRALRQEARSSGRQPRLCTSRAGLFEALDRSVLHRRREGDQAGRQARQTARNGGDHHSDIARASFAARIRWTTRRSGPTRRPRARGPAPGGKEYVVADGDVLNIRFNVYSGLTERSAPRLCARGAKLIGTKTHIRALFPVPFHEPRVVVKAGRRNVAPRHPRKGETLR